MIWRCTNTAVAFNRGAEIRVKVWLQLIKWQMNRNCDSELGLLCGSLLYLLRLAKFSTQKLLAPISTSYFPFNMYPSLTGDQGKGKGWQNNRNHCSPPKVAHSNLPHKYILSAENEDTTWVQSPNRDVLSRAVLIIHHCSLTKKKQQKKNNITALKHSFNVRVGWRHKLIPRRPIKMDYYNMFFL